MVWFFLPCSSLSFSPMAVHFLRPVMVMSDQMMHSPFLFVVPLFPTFALSHEWYFPLFFSHTVSYMLRPLLISPACFTCSIYCHVYRIAFPLINFKFVQIFESFFHLRICCCRYFCCSPWSDVFELFSCPYLMSSLLPRALPASCLPPSLRFEVVIFFHDSIFLFLNQYLLLYCSSSSP
jgi:hypothetical protein